MRQNLQRARWLGNWWRHGASSGFAGWVAVTLPLSPMPQPATPFHPLIAQTALQGDIIINAPIILPYPYPTQPQQRVRVTFVAQGADWGAVYLDGRPLFRPTSYNRRQEFWLNRGAYHLQITGIVSSDVWASGYLDLGRDDANALIVVFSKTGGVQVTGDPYAWLPDVAEER